MELALALKRLFSLSVNCRDFDIVLKVRHLMTENLAYSSYVKELEDELEELKNPKITVEPAPKLFDAEEKVRDQ